MTENSDRLEGGISRDELRYICRSCGAVYNTTQPESRPNTCYECGESHPWKFPTELRYGVRISGANQTSWDAFATRHEAIGEAAIRNRRNPDVEFVVTVDEVVVG